MACTFSSKADEDLEASRIVEVPAGMESAWAKIKDCLRNTAEKILGSEKPTERKQWFDSECSLVNERKNQAYQKMQTRRTRSNVENYKERRREENEFSEERRGNLPKNS